MSCYQLVYLCLALILAFIAPATSSASPETIPCSKASYVCGHPAVDPTVSNRIVGGSEAPEGAWPWTVMLLERGSQVCGGAILSERIIITAAHCVEGPVSSNPRRWQVVAGAHHLWKAGPQEQVVKVRDIIMHENYDNYTMENDMALMIMDPPLRWTSTARPICLPPPELEVQHGDHCMLAGWGKALGTGKVMKLNQVMLPIINDSICAQADFYGDEFISNKTICAGYVQGGADACQGDSGGPLVCKSDDQWFIQGIVSWGYDCAKPNWPGLYTEVNKFIPWLQDKMSSHQFCSIVG